MRQRLYDEMKKYDYLESWCLGDACNSTSELYKKADSLFMVSNLQNAVTYFNDTFYSIKYYSFLFILDHNDSLAFELLKQNIADKHTIDYQFADAFSNAKFIELIVYEYRGFIKAKYLYGGKAHLGGHRSLTFPSKNKKLYKRKTKELSFLIKSYNLHVWTYCCQ